MRALHNIESDNMEVEETKTQNDLNLWPKVENTETLSPNKNNEHAVDKSHSKPASQRRRALSQYLAAFAKNLLLVDLGMVIAFPTIVIPPLLDAQEGLRFTEDQASWYGSIVYFCQPLGSLTAAATLDFLGRKRAMLVLNIPFFCCWVALYYTQAISLLFVLTGIMGFSIGSIEASILTYVGEISEPRLRGTLTSLAEIAEYIGFVFTFFLGTVTDWRTSALISALVPVVCFVSLLQIPETPIWLLSRGRNEEALKSLCWLRGWVTPDQVQDEFDDLVRYNKASKVLSKIPKRNSEQQHTFSNKVYLSNDTLPTWRPSLDHKNFTDCFADIKVIHEDQKKVNFKNSLNNFSVETDKESTHSVVDRKVSFFEKLNDFFRREMVMPMFLVCSFFFFTYGSGMWAIRPYNVPVLMDLGFVMDPFLATTVFTAVGLGGCVVCTVTVHRVGKRPLALVSIVGCALSCLSLGTYSLYLEELEGITHPWMPMVMMLALGFFTGIGMDPLPWMYLSEVFPFRGRSMACGVAAGISYVFGFIATKTFLVLEDILTLSGTFYLYGTLNVVGFIFFYFYLPETEGIPMEEIEESYKKKAKTAR